MLNVANERVMVRIEVEVSLRFFFNTQVRNSRRDDPIYKNGLLWTKMLTRAAISKNRKCQVHMESMRKNEAEIEYDEISSYGDKEGYATGNLGRR